MLPDLNSVAEQQAQPTHNTESMITHFLDYTSTNPTAVVEFRASDMVLYIYSDASYLSKPQAHSRNIGHYYLRSQPYGPTKAPHIPPP